MNDIEQKSKEIKVLQRDIRALEHDIRKLKQDARRCMCGKADWDDGDELIDVRVLVLESSDGYADETRWFCTSCLDALVSNLILWGFGNHQHGGTNMLQDTNCEEHKA